jgi:UPF0271 protein
MCAKGIDGNGVKTAVADASAFIQGLPFGGILKLYTTPLVEKELEGLKGIGLQVAANLIVMSPSEEALKKVRESAKTTGDDARVSEADIEVLALAVELKLPIITDDYSIQNLAWHLKVDFITVREKGIVEEVHWTYRCRGCHKTFDKKLDDCPVCGSEVRSYRGPKGTGVKKAKSERKD